MIEKHVPAAGGKYTPAVKANGLIFTAGMTPKIHGQLTMTGKVRNDVPVEEYRDAARQAASNCFEAAKNVLAEDEVITRAVRMDFMVNAEPDYLYHSKVADFASEFFYEEMGEEGLAARAAVGMGSLPNEAPLEIQMVFAYEKRGE